MTFYVGQKLEGILGKGRVTAVAREVQFHVGACEVDGFSRRIDRVHQFGAATHGINGKAAGVAEHIEHTPAAGIMLKQSTVVALIHKEARFLSAQPVDVELQSVFHSHTAGIVTYYICVLRIELGFIWQSGL